MKSNLANNIYDVIIVGADPVRLATALGFNQQGLKNILIIEQAKALNSKPKSHKLFMNNSDYFITCLFSTDKASTLLKHDHLFSS